jgi:hypothetical protein
VFQLSCVASGGVDGVDCVGAWAAIFDAGGQQLTYGIAERDQLPQLRGSEWAGANLEAMEVKPAL